MVVDDHDPDRAHQNTFFIEQPPCSVTPGAGPHDNRASREGMTRVSTPRDEARFVDRLIFDARSGARLTCVTTVTEARHMTQAPSAGPIHDLLDARIRRSAIVASSLLIAVLVLVSGAGRAVARPAAPIGQASRPTAALVRGQEATVEIPSIGISLPVVTGAQDVIDRGVAAHYNGAQWRHPTDPGRAGTYWLAAHNATHGSPFENLHAIAKGAEVRITRLDGRVFTYVVTGRDVVGTSTTLESVYGHDTTTPRILLQTCEGASERLLVHGVLTSVTPG